MDCLRNMFGVILIDSVSNDEVRKMVNENRFGEQGLPYNVDLFWARGENG